MHDDRRADAGALRDARGRRPAAGPATKVSPRLRPGGGLPFDVISFALTGGSSKKAGQARVEELGIKPPQPVQMAAAGGSQAKKPRLESNERQGGQGKAAAGRAERKPGACSQCAAAALTTYTHKSNACPLNAANRRALDAAAGAQAQPGLGGYRAVGSAMKRSAKAGTRGPAIELETSGTAPA